MQNQALPLSAMGRFSCLHTVLRAALCTLLVPMVFCFRVRRLVTLGAGNVKSGHTGRGNHLVSDGALSALAHGAQACSSRIAIGAAALVGVAVHAARACALFADCAARVRRLLDCMPACNQFRQSDCPSFPCMAFTGLSICSGLLTHTWLLRQATPAPSHVMLPCLSVHLHESVQDV